MASIIYADLLSESQKTIPYIKLSILRTYYYEYGISLNSILEEQFDIPSGLDSITILSWIYGYSDKADPYHIRWVLSRCEELTKFQPR